MSSAHIRVGHGSLDDKRWDRRASCVVSTLPLRLEGKSFLYCIVGSVMNEISGGGVNGQVGGYPGARRAIPQARTVRPLMLNSGGRRPSRYFFGGKEVLQAWGVAPRPTCRRSEATLDKEDDNPRDERDTGSFTFSWPGK